MKVVKKEKLLRSVTLRIAEMVMEKIDAEAKRNDISRQCLIEAILEKALTDRNFKIEIETPKVLKQGD